MPGAARELVCRGCGRRVRVVTEGEGVLRCCGTEMAAGRTRRARYATQRMVSESADEVIALLLEHSQLEKLSLFRLPVLTGDELAVELIGFRGGERTPGDIVAEAETVLVTLEGAGTLTLEERRHELVPGTAVIVAAGTPYALAATPRKKLLVAAIAASKG